MAEEQVVFNGFLQGSVMEEGALGPVKSYIVLKNNTTGRVLNVEIAESELAKVVALAHGNDGDLQEDQGAITHPNLEVDPEGAETGEVPQPQEIPTPESAFPEEG